MAGRAGKYLIYGFVNLFFMNDDNWELNRILFGVMVVVDILAAIILLVGIGNSASGSSPYWDFWTGSIVVLITAIVCSALTCTFYFKGYE
jgi:uncharacterized membrane protein